MTAPPFRQVLLCCFFGRNLGSQGSLHVSLSPTNMDPHTSSASLSLSLSVGFKCLYCIYSTLCHWDRRAIWTSLFRCSDPAIYICIYSIYIYHCHYHCPVHPVLPSLVLQATPGDHCFLHRASRPHSTRMRCRMRRNSDSQLQLGNACFQRLGL